MSPRPIERLRVGLAASSRRSALLLVTLLSVAVMLVGACGSSSTSADPSGGADPADAAPALSSSVPPPTTSETPTTSTTTTTTTTVATTTTLPRLAAVERSELVAACGATADVETCDCVVARAEAAWGREKILGDARAFADGGSWPDDWRRLMTECGP